MSFHEWTVKQAVLTPQHSYHSADTTRSRVHTSLQSCVRRGKGTQRFHTRWLPLHSTVEMTKLQKGKIDQRLPEITRESRPERRPCGCESDVRDLVMTRFPSVPTVAMTPSQLSHCTVVLKDGTLGEATWRVHSTSLSMCFYSPIQIRMAIKYTPTKIVLGSNLKGKGMAQGQSTEPASGHELHGCTLLRPLSCERRAESSALTERGQMELRR